MAPPVKRQKRLVVLSSDDEASDAKPTLKPVPATSWAKKPKSGTRRSCTATELGPNVLAKNLAAKPKPAGNVRTSRPISLFFRAETQAQQPHNQKRPEAVTSEVEDHADLIIDDSSIENLNDRGETNTKTGLNDRRKRLSPACDDAATTNRPNLQSGSHRFKIPGHASSISTTPGKFSAAEAKPGTVDLRPWAERYGPNSLEELMIHKKKVSDVRNWMEDALRGQDCKRLLILKGPAGAGKTATVSMLAKALGIDVSEWKNPVGSEFSSEAYLPMSAHFEDFLGRSGKFNNLALADIDGNVSATPSHSTYALDEKTRDRIILMEEFPNTFLATSIALRSFRLSVLRYLAFNTPSMTAFQSKEQDGNLSIAPLVMIITETRLTTTTAASDSFTAHRLLGPELSSHPCVSTIEFNPIAPTYLTKALDLVVQKEARQSGRRRVPGPAALKKLGEVGDIRSAIGSLEFLCLRRKDEDDWGGRVASKAMKGVNTASTLTKLEKDSLDMVSQRESTLGLFHAVGKVVYNKRDDFADRGAACEPPAQPPPHLSGHVRRRVSQVSANQLIDETGTDIEIFIAALHENFVLSCEGRCFTGSLNGCIDALSDSDILGPSQGRRFGSSGDLGGGTFQGALSDTLRQDEMRFQVAVRGLLFALPDPVKRRTHLMYGESGGKNDRYKMSYPTSIRLSRQIEEIDGLIGQWTDGLRATDVKLGEAKGRHGRQFVLLSSTLEAQPSKVNAQHRLRPDEDGPQPFRTSMGCTKKELITETLPYITKIEQRNAGSPHLYGLERITRYHAVAPSGNEASEDEDVGAAAAFSNWATDGPIEGSVTSLPSRAGLQRGIEQASNAANTVVLPVEVEVGQLYLSDDDIEDDDIHKV